MLPLKDALKQGARAAFRAPEEDIVAQTRRFSSCLAGIEPAAVPLLSATLALIGSEHPTIISPIDVTGIGSLEPDVLVLDVDALETDPLETIRMTRFLLRSGVIAIYTGTITQSWGLACHLAGANCVLSKRAGEDRTALGLMHAIRGGCFTDPAFEAA
jgi:hypothetical protein